MPLAVEPTEGNEPLERSDEDESEKSDVESGEDTGIQHSEFIRRIVESGKENGSVCGDEN